MTIKPPAPPYVGPAAHTSAGSNQPIHRIVIHCTVSPCVDGGARATAAFFRDPKSGGSAHYVVDPGEAVQVVYDNTIAWHAPPNANSLGVELTDALVSEAWDKANAARWQDARHTAMLQRAADLVAQLALAYKVPIVKLSAADLVAGKHGICGHVDVSQAFHQSDHWDPGASFPWDAFMAQVHASARKLRAADKPAPAPTPTPTPAPAPAPKPPVTGVPTREAKGYRLGHPNKLLGQTEAFGDSDRGIRYFAKKGCTRVDGNAIPSGDNPPVEMNTHYGLFLRHGFTTRDGSKINRNLPVGHFTAADLTAKFWTRRGHYVIDRSVDRIRLAFQLGMDYELEVKAPASAATVRATWAEVLKLQQEFPGRRVIVKVYNNRPGKAMWLKPWHEAGAPTLITTHTPLRRTDRRAAPFCDEYRGFKPRWI